MEISGKDDFCQDCSPARKFKHCIARITIRKVAFLLTGKLKRQVNGNSSRLNKKTDAKQKQRPPDSVKADLYGSIGAELVNFQPDSAKLYIDKVHQLALDLHNKKQEARSLNLFY